MRKTLTARDTHGEGHSRRGTLTARVNPIRTMSHPLSTLRGLPCGAKKAGMEKGRRGGTARGELCRLQLCQLRPSYREGNRDNETPLSKPALRLGDH
jgi:hypothetical protein